MHTLPPQLQCLRCSGLVEASSICFRTASMSSTPSSLTVPCLLCFPGARFDAGAGAGAGADADAGAGADTVGVRAGFEAGFGATRLLWPVKWRSVNPATNSRLAPLSPRIPFVPSKHLPLKEASILSDTRQLALQSPSHVPPAAWPLDFRLPAAAASADATPPPPPSSPTFLCMQKALSRLYIIISSPYRLGNTAILGEMLGA